MGTLMLLWDDMWDFLMTGGTGSVGLICFMGGGERVGNSSPHLFFFFFYSHL